MLIKRLLKIQNNELWRCNKKEICAAVISMSWKSFWKIIPKHCTNINKHAYEQNKNYINLLAIQPSIQPLTLHITLTATIIQPYPPSGGFKHFWRPSFITQLHTHTHKQSNKSYETKKHCTDKKKLLISDVNIAA